MAGRGYIFISIICLLNFKDILRYNLFKYTIKLKPWIYLQRTLFIKRLHLQTKRVPFGVPCNGFRNVKEQKTVEDLLFGCRTSLVERCGFPFSDTKRTHNRNNISSGLRSMIQHLQRSYHCLGRCNKKRIKRTAIVIAFRLFRHAWLLDAFNWNTAKEGQVCNYIWSWENKRTDWIWGSHSGGYEAMCLLEQRLSSWGMRRHLSGYSKTSYGAYKI
jgi:hypothetical protein